MTEVRTGFLCREGIDALRNKSFLDLLRGPDGKAIAVDSEHAMMCLAACLGLIQPGCDNWKDVLYVRDPMTNMICDILKIMKDAGVLKYDGRRDQYLAIDLNTARYVTGDDSKGPEHAARSYELCDKKLFWPEDLYRAIDNDDIWYVEDNPELGSRRSFKTVLYWSMQYHV